MRWSVSQSLAWWFLDSGIGREVIFLVWRNPLWILLTIRHVVLDLACTRSTGSRSAFERFQRQARYCRITTEVCRCDKFFVFANSKTEICLESCIIHFPTTPPCSTTVHVLVTGEVLILFSLRQMSNLGCDCWIGSSRRQDYMPIFWFVFFCRWVFHNGTHCVGLDESSVSASDKIEWSIWSPKRDM